MISLDEWFASRLGQSLLVPGAAEADRGQCVQSADDKLHFVDGFSYVFANAIDWWNNFDNTPQLRDNFVKITDGSIKKGDFVIFNTLVGSKFGHIDVAMQDGTTEDFIGADSNWNGNLTVHKVHHVGAQYVLGVLRLKGGGDMPSHIGDDEARALIQMGYGYTNELDIEGAIPGLMGVESNTAIRQVWAAPSHNAYLQYIGDLTKAAAGGDSAAAKKLEQIKKIVN